MKSSEAIDASEGKLMHKEASPTAATAGDTRYKPTEGQVYRVQMQTAMGGMVFTDVEALTGDEAAEAGVLEYPGARVAHVAPAPKKAA
jgi:hypothetical protein